MTEPPPIYVPADLPAIVTGVRSTGQRPVRADVYYWRTRIVAWRITQLKSGEYTHAVCSDLVDQNKTLVWYPVGDGFWSCGVHEKPCSNLGGIIDVSLAYFQQSWEDEEEELEPDKDNSR